MSIGRTVGGRFELLHSIGAGGCATVWLGRHRDTGALAAVKLLDAGSEQAERFRREAEISAQLAHRNLVRVFDYVHEPDGTAALVMEHLRGETLEDVVGRHGSLPAYAAVACVVAILRGLEHAHERGVIHRDLKPSNVFLAVEPDGYVVPKVLDFGVAKSVDAKAILLTQHGHIVGTPAYMSPEQVRGEHVDVTSDLFSVGAMLYEMLTGELAFGASSPHAAMMAILERDVAPHERIPEAIWAVLQRALQKAPDARHPSATALREALEASVHYTDQTAPLALQSLAPRVAELPALPVRVPSRPSIHPHSTPPSLLPVATDESVRVPVLTVTTGARLVGTARGKLWAGLAAVAAVVLVGATATRDAKAPALSLRAARMAHAPAAAQPAPAVVDVAPVVLEPAAAAAKDEKHAKKASTGESDASPRPVGVSARARHVARTPGF